MYVEPTPAVGRIVHYVSYGTPNGEFLPEHRAAIITAIKEYPDGFTEVPTLVDLCVLNPNGFFFNQDVLQSQDEHVGGTWHWPERV